MSAAGVAESGRDLRAKLAARLAANQDGILEKLAADHGVTVLDAVGMLPEASRVMLPGTLFEAAMGEAARWGEVVFIVHTANIVLECRGRVPEGSMGRGYFNIHAPDTAIGGHIRADRCRAIALVRRPFMGHHGLSLQFFDEDGAAMFKIFARRRPDRSLDPEQAAAIEASVAKLAEQARAF